MKQAPDIYYTIDELKKLYDASTSVVGWYAHGPGDQCAIDEATVRGPFVRWLYVTGPCSKEYEQHVASLREDAEYAAAAMCSVPHLINEIEELKNKNKKASDLLELISNENWILLRADIDRLLKLVKEVKEELK